MLPPQTSEAETTLVEKAPRHYYYDSEKPRVLDIIKFDDKKVEPYSPNPRQVSPYASSEHVQESARQLRPGNSARIVGNSNDMSQNGSSNRIITSGDSNICSQDSRGGDGNDIDMDGNNNKVHQQDFPSENESRISFSSRREVMNLFGAVLVAIVVILVGTKPWQASA